MAVVNFSRLRHDVNFNQIDEATEPQLRPQTYETVEHDTERDGRYFVTENRWGNFTVADTTTGTTTDIRYNFTGSSDNTATTWDFAPLDEQMEVDDNGYARFRDRMHRGDEQFIGRQVIWNQRLEQFHRQSEVNGTVDAGGLHCWTGTGTDTWTVTGTATATTDQRWWITSDIGEYHGGVPWLAKHAPRLHVKLHRAKDRLSKFSKILRLNETAEQRQKRLAEKKSMKLLKDWLDPHEFTELMKRGELEIFAEDVVYIVRKDPHKTVQKIEKDGTKREFCNVPVDMGFATGDVLLTKILMLKTNPELFESKSNSHTIRT